MGGSTYDVHGRGVSAFSSFFFIDPFLIGLVRSGHGHSETKPFVFFFVA